MVKRETNLLIAIAALPVVMFQMVTAPNAFALEETDDDKIARRAVQLIQQRCVKCHSDTVANAGVIFAYLDNELDVWKHRAKYTKALDMLRRGIMPPEDAPPLRDADRELVVGWIERTLENVDVDQIPRDPGSTPPRRLTRWEYTYTVQDLFGIDADPGHFLPPDQIIGDGFDNDAITLTIEPLWFEKALEAADESVRAVWSDRDALNRLLIAHPSPLPPVESADFVIPPDRAATIDTGSGDFTVLARVIGTPRRVFLRSLPQMSFAPGSKEFALDRRGMTYRIQRGRELRAVNVPYTLEEERWVGLSLTDGRAALFYDGEFLASRTNMAREDADNQAIKIGYPPRVRKDDDPQRKKSELLEFLFFPNGTQDDAMTEATGGDPSAVKQEASFRWEQGMETLLPEGFITAEAAGEQVIERFLERAFRRAPTPAELRRYLELYETEIASGIPFEIALQRPIAAALAAPSFLYRMEEHGDSDEIEPIASMGMASRLSYFLWSSMPDDALREAGVRGDLTDDRALLEQTDRMLADPRAERFFDRFITQWLRTEGLGNTIRPDKDRFPEVSDSLLSAMRRESAVMFGAAVRENRSLLSFLDSDSVFVNGELAAHYGIKDVIGPEWREVQLNDSPRGGLLTQPAALTVSSSPRRTSPVFRGKWVLEVLLGEPPPPPPPNVPPLEEPTESGGTTLRQLLEAHRNQEACAGCHSRIDPYGLAMEQFDAVGRWRTDPQDTRTTLFNGETLEGINDLKRYLVDQKGHAFVRHLSKRLLSYALGRELKFPDERAVEGIMNQLEQDEFRTKTLVQAIVLSEPFRYRKNPSSS